MRCCGNCANLDRTDCRYGEYYCCCRGVYVSKGSSACWDWEDDDDY
jgi:hypothetical protein